MTETPTTPAVSANEEAEFERMRTDAVLTGRVMVTGQAVSSGEYWAGLLAAALVDTAGSPLKLPMYMWPDQDAVVVQEIWDMACVVAVRAAQFAASPRLHGARLQMLQAQLTQAGFDAMGGSVARSRRLVEGVHPADWDMAGEH